MGALRHLHGGGLVILLLASLAHADVLVLAASSLTESLQKVATAWTAQGHPTVTFSFDASSKLAKQIEAGAPADLYISADAEWMDHLDKQGLVEPRVNLVGNSLVAIVPAGSGASPDLTRPEIKHLALGAETVPIGRYARAALASLGTWEAVKERVVTGDNVRSVLGWVATGEAEAGVVYATDALVEPRVRAVYTFPAASHPRIVYPAAVVKGATHRGDAAAFLAYCRSTAGLAVFYAAGFSPA